MLRLGEGKELFNAYIDESGDEGFRIKQGQWVSSKWFVIGALVVRASNDLVVSRNINHIKTGLLSIPADKRLRPLHFQNLSHKKRKAVINEIAKTGLFRFIAVGIDKQEIYDNVVKAQKAEKQLLYNFATRLLLERVTWLVNDYGGICNLVFEHRSNTSYDKLNEYIMKTMTYPDCGIKNGVLHKWEALNKSQSKNLQVADVLVSSVFAALEEDEYGNVEESYLLRFLPFLYRRNKNLFSYGLKLFPHGGELDRMRERYDWLKTIK